MSISFQNSADRLPVPLCVNAGTSLPRPGLTAAELDQVGGDLDGAASRSLAQKTLAPSYTVPDPMDLSMAGWGIVFATDLDPNVRVQLQPLLDLRARQVRNPKLFQVFDGAGLGVTPGMTASSWAFSRGVSLSAPVDPRKGVPYYLLLVGSPQSISFEFQAMLKMQWAVGRLYFDNIEDYGGYARSVVEYESEQFTPVQRKNAAVWLTRNVDDDATLLLSSAFSEDFMDPENALGNSSQFSLQSFTSEQATKPQLLNILRGNIDGGPPALVFTGSHGTEYPLSNLDQRRLQGALLTQEWTHGAVIGPENQFSAADIPADAQLQGTMFFLFACYSGGCPQNDSYSFQADGSPRLIASEALIAQLPQALLSHGALAVFAHVDLAFTYSFTTDDGTPQPQVIRTPLELLMRGKRAGFAADSLTLLWSTLAAQIAEISPVGSAEAAANARDAAVRGRLIVARNDARNYIVLGDPAVRLRIEKLA